MRKLKIKKIFASKNKINGNLSKLCNIRNAIKWQDKEKTESLLDVFEYEFEEINYIELLNDDDKIYVIQTASNKFIEVEKEDLIRFDI